MEPDKEKYPELQKLAQKIARTVIIKINEDAPRIKTDAVYKEQATLELLIDELQLKAWQRKYF